MYRDMLGLTVERFLQSWYKIEMEYLYFNGLAQDCSNSIANALELLTVLRYVIDLIMKFVLTLLFVRWFRN